MLEQLDVEAELQVGPSGTFEVAVDGRPVVRKVSQAFPTEQEVVDSVSRALAG